LVCPLIPQPHPHPPPLFSRPPPPPPHHWVTSHSIIGGHSYDAVIVACAQAGRTDTRLTFNLRYFSVGPEMHSRLTLQLD
jgi:hypothetical protein